ncbi:MAG: OmpA family protein [Chlamydiales bacterium]|nr:OmpA family protein [Chlamydiales bacterium]
MKRLFVRMLLLVAALSFTVSCSRSSDDVWNDTQSAGRHVARGVKTAFGYHGESREVNSPDDFDSASMQNHPSEFIGFEEETMRVGGPDNIQQAHETPGESGSSIPGIESFSDPALDPELAEIFKHIRFDYNSSLVKGSDNMATISQISEWMKNHPNVYVFVEGHCDSRGPAAYNFALGANRSNAIRNMMIKEGVVYDRIFTVSYGKERPIVEGDGEEIWSVNRRGQFKIYEKN